LALNGGAQQGQGGSSYQGTLGMLAEMRTIPPPWSELHLTAHWDNSANNKWNPDPTATVRWGNQSWQEMLSATIAVIVDRTVDPKTVVERGTPPRTAGAQQNSGKRRCHEPSFSKWACESSVEILRDFSPQKRQTKEALEPPRSVEAHGATYPSNAIVRGGASAIPARRGARTSRNLVTCGGPDVGDSRHVLGPVEGRVLAQF
jgi:hypothetical protein